MFKDLDNRIILSISYTDQFQYPLTNEEVFLRLVGADSDTSLDLVKKRLDNLVSEGRVFFDKGFYFLTNRDDFVEIRLKRKKYSQKKWKEVAEFVGFVKKIPWIEGIVITGSQAVNNAKKNDDVDFLIIAQEKRLWLARIFVAAFAFIKGKKRSWDKEEENSWCLNMWVDSKSLQLPERLRNIYGSFEISQAIWVYDKRNTKKRFLELNSWAKEYLPNYFDFQWNSGVLKSAKKQRERGGSFVLNYLDNLLFFVQYLYMRSHMTRERVGRGFAFFHPRDTKKQIFSKWLKKYKENLI